MATKTAQATLKDFFGKPLFVGSKVAIIKPDYRELIEAKVIGITDKRVNVEYAEKRWCRYDKKDETIWTQLLQKPEQLIKK